MRRLVLPLVAGLLLLCGAPAALAQQDESQFDDEPETLATPEPTPDEFDGDPESVPTPDPVCDRGGADGDYAYCDPCPSPDVDYGTDGDYAYCAVPAASGGDEGGDGPPRRRAQPVAAGRLPVTGSETSFIALFGLGLLALGTGLRLRLGSERGL